MITSWPTGVARSFRLWCADRENLDELPGGAAFSHTFAGKDYNDRYRIKRKAQRWKEKFAALPPAERLAIMVALGEVE